MYKSVLFFVFLFLFYCFYENIIYGASLYLPSSKTVLVEEEFSVPVMLNTEGKEVVGVDVVILFNKNFLELIDIKTGDEFKTFLPLDDEGKFNFNKVKTMANLNGRIEIGAISFDKNNNNVTSPFKGVLGVNNPLFTLKFKAKKVGLTKISYFIFS